MISKVKKITILSLFPKMVEDALSHSIIKRATDANLVNIEVVNFRDFSNNKHHNVDDVAYGGGPGMVLTCQPIVDAIRKFKTENSLVIILNPSGEPYIQAKAIELANNEKDLILICGHYEGFDERIFEYVDLEISLGDFVLTGGEIAALAITDSLVRLIPGVIKKASFEEESFMNGLLDHPSYTKPRDFEGHLVPETLFSGNHKKIAEWRHEAAYEKTLKKRPDLILKKTKGGN